MPEGHEGEDGEDVCDAAGPCDEARDGCFGTRFRRSFSAAQWDVEVPYDPAVEGTVPASPEGEGRVIVRHASDHVLWWVDAVD